MPEITVVLTQHLANELRDAAEELGDDPAELVRCALATWLMKPAVKLLDQWTPAGVQVVTF